MPIDLKAMRDEMERRAEHRSDGLDAGNPLSLGTIITILDRAIAAEADRDALLAERHAICDALRIDNDADAANPAGVALRVVAERDVAEKVADVAGAARDAEAAGEAAYAVFHETPEGSDVERDALAVMRAARSTWLSAESLFADALAAYRATKEQAK